MPPKVDVAKAASVAMEDDHNEEQLAPMTDEEKQLHAGAAGMYAIHDKEVAKAVAHAAEERKNFEKK